MKALWRHDLDQGKHDPLEIVSVVTVTGSTISAALIVPLDPHAQPIRIEVPGPGGGDDAGLLEVIQAQMEAIDELSAGRDSKLEGDEAKELAHLREWGDQFPVLLENLCEAMGLARQPVGPTGIPELDIILDLAR